MRRLAGLGLIVAASSGVASASTSLATHDLSRVLIEYDGATQLSPDVASMSFRVRNRSGQTRNWVIELTSAGGYLGSRTSRFELEVEDGGDRTFELLVPLTGGPGSWMQMRAFGYGLSNPGGMHVVGNGVASAAAVSSNLTMVSPEIRLIAETSRQEIAIDPERLSSDWRAYFGLSTLWLDASEWNESEPAVRRAIMDWVAWGGRLVLVEPGDTVRDEGVQEHGMGAIVRFPADVSLAAVSASASAFASVLAVLPEDDSVAWASSLVEPIEIHKGLLSIVLLGYLVLAAPVNLLVLSPRARRMRLFWTMPAIALGASALLAVVIVLQDGLGGTGIRTSFVYLVPDSHREIVVQEQVSRTGALLSRSFSIDDDVVMTSLQTDHRGSELVFASSGVRYEGDWFRSRSVQAHRIQRSRPSRARIEQVGTDGDAPRILSSIDETLAELYYRDLTGACWHAKDVHPGRPVTLQRATEADYSAYWGSASYRTAGPRIRTRLTAVFERRGAFLAVTAKGNSGVPVETLRSIRWTESPVLYAGHIEEPER